MKKLNALIALLLCAPVFAAENMGAIPLGATIPCTFNTFGTNGEALTATGLAVTDVEIYKNGSATQRSSDAGFTLIDTDGLDIDGQTGYHGFTVNTGDNTDAGFYVAGSFYDVNVNSITVNTQTVAFTACKFRLVAAENTAGVPAADTLRIAGTAQTGRDIGASVLLSSGTGTGQISLSSGAVLLQPTQTGVTIPTVTTLTGHTPQTGDAYARLGAPAGASIAADIVVLDNFVDDLESRLGTPSNLGGGATVAGNLSDIEAQTDDIGAAGAGLTVLATQSSVNTIDDFLDTEMAAVLADTNEVQISLAAGGLIESMVDDLQTEVDGIQADTEDLQNRVPAALVSGRMSSDAVALSGDTAAADLLESLLDIGVGSWGIKSAGTAQAYTAGTPSLTLATGETYGDNTLEGNTVFIRGSTQGYWQQALIASNVGSTDVATLEAALPVAASGTIDYIIFGTAAATGGGGGGGLDAAGMRAALGMSAADLDAQLDAIKSDSAAILVDTGTTLDDLVDDLESRLGTPSNLGGGATVAQNLSDIEAQTDDIGAAGAGLTAADDTVMARLGAPAGASMSADIAAVKVDTAAILVDTSTTLDDMVDDLETRITALRAGYLDNLSAGAVATSSALTTLSGLVDDLETRLSAARAGYLDNLSAGAVATAAGLATNTSYIDTEIAAILAIANKLDTALELDGAVYRYTINALEQAPVGGGGGSTDWTSDERTALRAILGIPPSGTTPADPSTGVLDTIRDLVVVADAAVDTLAATVGAAGAGLTAADDAVMTRLGTPAGASVSADIAAKATQVSVDDLPTNAELATSQAAADDATLAAVAAVPEAVGNLVVEDQGGGVSLKCVNAVMMAALNGDMTTVGQNSTYRDPSGTEIRGTGTVTSNGNRAGSITCPTY